MMPNTATFAIETAEMACEVYLQVHSQAQDLPALAAMQRWVSAAVRDERDETEVSICIVDAEESRELNSRYRGKDKPTNVLSFAADLPEELGLPLLGDLVICAPVVTEEAALQGKAAEAHWAHMLVHGTLHLLGYDHINDAEAEQMEALETLILTGLGYPAPYAIAAVAVDAAVTTTCKGI